MDTDAAGMYGPVIIQMEPGSGFINDLATLSDLDETILLEELQARYTKDLIYTNIGDILIAVNPYKHLPIYGAQIAEQFSCETAHSRLPPHVFAVAARAYQTLQRTWVNQCCVVSGESGAGKTEMTKLLVQHIVQQCRDQNTDLQHRVIQVNPLLEAFGNAVTVVNRNSSRFGKFIELSFTPDGAIYGAKLDEYLLEKCRVVGQGKDERNFHVFYAMFAGLTSLELRKLALEPPDNYRSSVFSVFICNTAFDRGKSSWFFCNMAFVRGKSSVFICNTAFLKGERIVSMKSLHQANDGRDALAKAVYSRIFSWIVRQINLLLQTPQHDRPDVDAGDLRHIGILDMAGFENFAVNSFEQLSINVANEQLQFYFNQHVFAWELMSYFSEDIRHPKIKYTNNKALLDMFLEKPLGLFSLLDEECRFPRSTDSSLVDKLNKHLSKNTYYKKSKHQQLAFTVNHFAGQVVYQAQGFLEKNRDTLSLNLIELLQKSASWIVHELFTAKLSDTGTLDVRARGRGGSKQAVLECRPPDMAKYAKESLSRKASKKIKQKMKGRKGGVDAPVPSQTTASLHFRNSLADLTEKLLQADPQFIRCIKPNNEKSANCFMSELVLEQLRYTGVLETTRIRRNGFPTRLTFSTFLERYRIVGFPVLTELKITAEECETVLTTAKVQHWQIGKTKVFLKYWHVERLNRLIDEHHASVLTVQKAVRGLIARQRYKQLRAEKQEQDLAMFSMTVQRHLEGISGRMEQQQQHDKERQRLKVQQQHGYGYYGVGHPVKLPGLSAGIRGPNRLRYEDFDEVASLGSDDSIQPTFLSSPQRQKTYHSSPEFYKAVIEDVMQRRDGLDEDIWCKVLYMQRNTLVSKFYVEEAEITIDGSSDRFDGDRIGLGYFNSASEDDWTTRAKSQIGKGIRLQQDNEGSIIATCLQQVDIVVKGHRDPQNHCLSKEIILQRGKLRYQTPVKIFDMKEFKSHMALQLRHESLDKDRLRRLSVSGLSFVADIDDDLQTPCWIAIVNLAALDAIDSPAVMREVRSSVVSLVQKKGTEEVLSSNQKKGFRPWSKINQRKSGAENIDVPHKCHRKASRQQKAMLQPSGHPPSPVSEGGASNTSGFDFQSSRQYFANLSNNSEDGRGPPSVVSSNASPRRNWAKVRLLQKAQEQELADKLQRIKKH